MLRAFILIPLIAFITFIDFLILGIFTGRKPYQPFNDGMLRFWSKVVLWISGVKVEVTGSENLIRDRSSVIVANHMSAFDIVACGYALPVTLRFIAKKELFRVPVFGQAMQWFGIIKIDRQNREKAIQSIELAKKRMRENKIAIIGFPEGTRSRNGEVGRFKKGLFFLATDTKSPVIPVTIDGSYEILQRGSLRIKPGTIYITIHKAVETEHIQPKDRQKLIDDVRNTIISAMKTKTEVLNEKSS